MEIISKQKYIYFPIVIILSVFILFSCTSKNMKKESTNINRESYEDRVAGEYIVTLREGVAEDFLYSYFSRLSVLSVSKIHDTVFLIKVENDPGPDKIKEEYLDNDRILNIQPNYKYELKPPEKRIIRVDIDEQ